jgi:hypothetical protein
VPGDELASHESGAAPADQGRRRGPGWRARLSTGRLPPSASRWLAMFGAALGGLLIRFLAPGPVGQADNRDGPRLMCGLGLEKAVPHGRPTFFRFAYFKYLTSPSCAGRHPYPSSELLPLEISRLLTPVFGLPGDLNLIALGGLYCVLAAVAIASLATGLRVPRWGQWLVAAACWLIIADAAFFDVFASPFSEPAALVGLLLVAAGVLYLGRGWPETGFGLALAGSGGFLAILSKEQYLVLAAPICLTLVLAAADRGPWRGLRRFRNREAGPALLVSALLAVMAAGYWIWNYTSHYGRRLQHIQAVDMIFTDIVTKRSTAPGQLRALGLPASWAKYAGDYYWAKRSVRFSPSFPRYTGKLTDVNIAHYLLTHPGYIASIGQSAAIFAQQFRVTQLGDYPISAGHQKGAYESRVVVITWLMHHLPANAGLWLYLPLWLIMTVLALAALRLSRPRPWRRDGAALVLCMTGCAIVAFIPPAYFAGISTTRHMVGSNLATALAVTVSVGLACSLTSQVVTQRRRGLPAPAELVTAVPAAPVGPGSR